jgi:PBSX family phage portal protein
MSVKIKGIVGPAGKDLEQSLDTEEHKYWSAVRDIVTKSSQTSPTTSDEMFDFSGDGEISPPFPFETLASIHENSSALGSNIDAMVTNVDGFGYMLDPVINFNSPDVNEQVRNILLRQAFDNSGLEDLLELDLESFKEIDVDIRDLEDKKFLWERIASVEKSRARSFFEFVNPLMPFIELRKKTRKEYEIFGNAGWEIIREDPEVENSRITQIYKVPFLNVKLRRICKEPVDTTMIIRKDEILFDSVRVQRYFRSFVRSHGSKKVFFKEFGDPRIMSRTTGKYYDSIEHLMKEEEDGSPANELFHWKIESPLSPYGVPRWIGALLSVIGSRAAEEVNFLYFDNKAIPPMVLMVSGGRLTESSVRKIESHVEERIKGRQNFHNIMVIEALPSNADPSEGDIEHHGKLRMELKPLVNEQTSDALFQSYDEKNQIKIGRSFRQSPIMTGDTRDMNRSTASTAKSMAEEQVYQPERDVLTLAFTFGDSNRKPLSRESPMTLLTMYPSLLVLEPLLPTRPDGFCRMRSLLTSIMYPLTGQRYLQILQRRLPEKE